MLGKLIKYEIKATGRIFLPMYLALIVFAIINHFMSFNPEYFTFPQGIALTIYILIFVGMFVTSFIVMIQRFYKNLLCEEGYLMFTLPVEPWKHIISKLVVSAMWTILSALVAVISIIIIVLQAVALTDIFAAISRKWSLLYESIGNSLYLFAIQTVIAVIVRLATSTLIIYAAMAIGQLSNNHKVLLSIVSFLGLYMLSQIAASLVFLPQLSKAESISYKSGWMLNMTIPDMMIPNDYIWGAVAFSAVFGTIYFIIANHILSKRLNLE